MLDPPAAVVVMGGMEHSEVEVIDFIRGGENSCMGHQTVDHPHAYPVGLKVEGRPTICGGGDYGSVVSVVSDCKSLDLETGHWSESFPLIEGR